MKQKTRNGGKKKENVRGQWPKGKAPQQINIGGDSRAKQTRQRIIQTQRTKRRSCDGGRGNGAQQWKKEKKTHDTTKDQTQDSRNKKKKRKRPTHFFNQKQGLGRSLSTGHGKTQGQIRQAATTRTLTHPSKGGTEGGPAKKRR